MSKINRDIKSTSRPFELGELFFSATDEKGVITSCNDVFLRVAGYSSEHVIGKPHNMIRHPHMPRCVFKILWDYLLAGRTIGAYVKNLAANGEYYWVYALACPIPSGFLSIRFKPTSPIFDKVSGLYEELLNLEESYGLENRREGLAASYEKALDSLKGLGFSSYDAFMFESLRAEMTNFCDKIEGTNFAENSDSDGIGAKLKRLTSLREDLEQKSRALETFVDQLQRLAVNASVRARHMGEAGRALGVIGEEISRVSRCIKGEVSTFSSQVIGLADAIRGVSFDLSMAALQASMAKSFVEDARKLNLSEEQQFQTYGNTADVLSSILITCETNSVNRARGSLGELAVTMSKFSNFVEFLARFIQTLQFAYVTGQAEAARVKDDNGFGTLLLGLSESSNSVRQELGKLRESVDSVGTTVQAFL